MEAIKMILRPIIETFLVIIVMQLILAVLGLLFIALFPPEPMMDTEPLKLEDY